MYRSYIAKNPVLVSILLFLVLFGTIQFAKPSFLYNSDGSLRNFGIGYRNKTIMPVWLLAILLGILCYLFILYYLSKHYIF
uniref:Uncharacterized protein n=1 Tax=viral metagenome TaxID=1070528 RepID=A0A6C0B0R4_9ZZZZ